MSKLSDLILSRFENEYFAHIEGLSQDVIPKVGAAIVAHLAGDNRILQEGLVVVTDSPTGFVLDVLNYIGRDIWGSVINTPFNENDDGTVSVDNLGFIDELIIIKPEHLTTEITKNSSAVVHVDNGKTTKEQFALLGEVLARESDVLYIGNDLPVREFWPTPFQPYAWNVITGATLSTDTVVLVSHPGDAVRLTFLEEISV